MIYWKWIIPLGVTLVYMTFMGTLSLMWQIAFR
jgi:hypothetical protein